MPLTLLVGVSLRSKLPSLEKGVSMNELRWKKACAVFVVCAATAVAADGQTFTTLVDFDGSNGATPARVTLVQGTDGGLYGTTDNLGDGPGTVFRLGTNGTLTTVYKFCSLSNCADGDLPISGVIVGK